MVAAGVRKTVESIKSLKIQGATAVAEQGLLALKTTRTADELKKAAQLLSQSRPTEPLLRNGLRYVLHSVHEGAPVKEAVDDFLEKLRLAERKIVENGAHCVKPGTTVLTYCHSSLVTRILAHAHKTHAKRFNVVACETRPGMQGRITATELARAGIPVTFVTDNAVRSVVNECQLVLVGADALTAEGGVVNKTGTALVALAAQEARTPVASACELLKFDAKTMHGFEEKLEQRSPSEVWSKPPRGVRVQNRVFEEVPARLVDFLITEVGIITPQSVLAEVKELYPWVF